MNEERRKKIDELVNGMKPDDLIRLFSPNIKIFEMPHLTKIKKQVQR